MSRHGELQYLADTLLINEFVNNLEPRAKTAGIIIDALGTIATTVKDIVVNSIDTSSAGSLAKSVVKLLEPAIMFRIHPLFGILDVVGQQMFGISVTDIFVSLVQKLMPKIQLGQSLVPEEVNRAGQEVAGSIGAEASSDMLIGLRYLKKEGQLNKLSQPFQLMGPRPTGGSLLFPSKHVPVLHKAFGFLGASRGKMLIVGFVVWLLKTILASAGLLAAGGLVAGLFGKKKEEAPEVSKEEATIAPYQPPTTVPAVMPLSPVQIHNLKPSGIGIEYHQNDNKTLWIVPVYGNVKNTLLLWATEIYPELKGNEKLVLSNPTFNSVANRLEKNFNPRKPRYLTMPLGVHRIKDVVDFFAGDIAAEIKESKAV